MIDAFLKLDGIKGEAKDHKHKDAIDVCGFTWAVDQVGVQNIGGGGGGAGKTAVRDMVVFKNVDRATPALLLFCVTGKHIASASLIVRKAGEHPVEYFTIKLEDVLITNVSDAGTQGTVLAGEKVSLNFARFHIDYHFQNKQGAKGPASSMGFDIKANKKL